jgi:HK97 family phage major capsid protein
MPTLAEAKHKVRELSTKALATVEDAALSSAEKKTVLDTIEPDIKTWTEEVQSLERFEDIRKNALANLDSAEPEDKTGDVGNAGGETKNVRPKSIGEQFVAHKAYMDLKNGKGFSGTGKWTTGDIELKTALTEGTAGSPGPGNAFVATPTVLPGIIQTLFQPLTIEALIPGGSTSSPLLRYLVETAVTNAAATVAELGLKPESALTFSKVDETLKKIATFLPVSDEMLEDYEQIQSYLNNRLELFVNLQREVQILRGDGTGTNLVGLLNRSGLATSIVKGTSPSISGDTDMDAIYRQITAIRITSFLEPDAVAIDPLGWENIVLSKDSQGRYYAGGPFLGTTTPNLWGKRVVPTTAMPSLTSLVGAFSSAAQVFSKGGLTVEASNSHADFFQRNETAIRAECRLLLAVYRPGAFGTVTNL